MNVKWLAATFKWELRKWWDMLVLFFGVVVVLWVVLAVVPVPQEHWHVAPATIAGAAMILAGANATFLGLLFCFLYPILTSFGSTQTSLMEQQMTRSYAYLLFSRLVLGAFTYLIGMGVLWVTMPLLQRFEDYVDRALFSAILAESPLILLPFVFLFAVGTPLLFLFTFNFIKVMRSGRSEKIDGRDTMGFVVATAIVALYPVAEQMHERLPFAAAAVIMLAGLFVLSITAVLLISRFIDRFAEVSA